MSFLSVPPKSVFFSMFYFLKILIFANHLSSPLLKRAAVRADQDSGPNPGAYEVSCGVPSATHGASVSHRPAASWAVKATLEANVRCYTYGFDWETGHGFLIECLFSVFLARSHLASSVCNLHFANFVPAFSTAHLLPSGFVFQPLAHVLNLLLTFNPPFSFF